MGTKERIVERVLLVTALSAVSILALIILFIFREGSPALAQVGLGKFIAGTKWAPGKGMFGILPMILGTAWVTAGALAFGVPLGLACAIFLAEMAPPWASRLLKPAVELLAAIPSVVYGFIGLVVLVPLIRVFLGGPGFSVLASSLVLAVMILPTMISISYDSLCAVPRAYRDGMIALGATRWQTIRMVVLPAARSGLVTAAILAMGRAVGETMAVIMVAGNATAIPVSPLDPVRTLTSGIALEMSYAAGAHRQALFAMGVILFIIIATLNLVARWVTLGRSKA